MATKILLDETAIELAEPTLASALREGVAKAEAAGRIVVEVHADGVALGADDLEEPSELPLEAVELKLTTADPVALVAVTLQDAADALLESGPLHTRAAELVQTGEQQKAAEELTTVLGVWQAAQQAVEHGSALVGTDLVAGIDGFQDFKTALAQQLSELQQALTTEDWSTVADVLAYDLVPQTEKFAEVLRGASESLRSTGA